MKFNPNLAPKLTVQPVRFDQQQQHQRKNKRTKTSFRRTVANPSRIRLRFPISALASQRRGEKTTQTRMKTVVGWIDGPEIIIKTWRTHLD